MSVKRLGTAISAALLVAGAAEASQVTMQTNVMRAGVQTSPVAYVAVVESLLAEPVEPGYGTAHLPVFSADNHTLFGSDRAVTYLFTVEFVVTPEAAGTWSFRAGVDFGYGGTMLLDGTALDFRPYDVWWDGSWESADVMRGTANLQAGTHVLQLYGLEDCCDGMQVGQFRNGAGDWVTFGDADGLQPVPEPGTVAMLLTGGALLAGYAARRRRQPATIFRFAAPGSIFRTLPVDAV